MGTFCATLTPTESPLWLFSTGYVLLRHLARMRDTVAAGLLLVALTSPAVLSFDPEWLRPRYHYANKLDGPGNYGVSS